MIPTIVFIIGFMLGMGSGIYVMGEFHGAVIGELKSRGMLRKRRRNPFLPTSRF